VKISKLDASLEVLNFLKLTRETKVTFIRRTTNLTGAYQGDPIHINTCKISTQETVFLK